MPNLDGGLCRFVSVREVASRAPLHDLTAANRTPYEPGGLAACIIEPVAIRKRMAFANRAASHQLFVFVR